MPKPNKKKEKESATEQAPISVLDRIKEILAKNNIFIVVSIDHANFKPHRFMIGNAHISDAANNHGEMLGDATLDKVPCARNGCKLLYTAHTSDKILFLQLTRNASNLEAQEELASILDIMKEDKIDGITFVETPEKYRMTNDKSSKTK